MLDLYKNIRLYRKQLHMTQEELAKKVGYGDRSSIAKIEAGKVDLPQSQIFKIADALNVTPSDLMGLDGILVDYLVKSSDGSTEYIIESTGKTRMDTERENGENKIMQLNRNTIAENIKTILNEKGLSQAEVAGAIGVSPQCFNTWTQGKAIPRMGKLQALADYLHVNKSDLIEPPSERSGRNRLMAYAERLTEMSIKVAEAYENADERTKIAVEVALGIGGDDGV